MGQRRKKKSGFGIIFWLAVIGLTGILFFVNRSNITQVLDDTQLREAVQTWRQERAIKRDARAAAQQDGALAPDGVSTIDDERSALRKRLVTPLVDSVLERDNPSRVSAQAAAEQAAAEQGITTSELEVATEIAQQLEAAAETQDPEATTAPAPPVAEGERTAYIYFIHINDAGAISPARVSRSTPRSTAPMTQSLQLLMDGLTSEENERGLLNLIPTESKLLSAEVRNNVAYLNFNEAFRFNSFGQEGSAAQILQIVYSVTEFSTVDSVQILIEGASVDYLNSDSQIFIGNPINRKQFG